MFNGIVTMTGKITHIEIKEGCHYFIISPKDSFDEIVIGESIAVNGVCLTVTDFTNHSFYVTVVPETLRLTNLGQLVIHDTVNLERPLTLNSRIGGHYVQGHVDGVGRILEIKNDDSDALLVKISLPETVSKYVVAKGFITLDGMSITVIESAPDWFTVTFIPHTQQVTIVHHYRKGTAINIEVDMMGKYIEKLLGAHIHANRN
jgi:riboflavin synthase